MMLIQAHLLFPMGLAAGSEVPVKGHLVLDPGEPGRKPCRPGPRPPRQFPTASLHPQQEKEFAIPVRL